MTEPRVDGMTNRERMLAIMAGKTPDRIPWIPRPDVWYEANRRGGTLPHKYRNCTLDEIRRDLRMGTWHLTPVYRIGHREIEVRTQERGRDTLTEYRTPRGSVTTLYRRSEKLERFGIAGQTVEKMIKRAKDYSVVEYIIQNTEIVPIYEEYLGQERMIGEDGYPMVFSAMDPLSQLMLEYVGYEDVYFHLQDYPREVARLSEALEDQARKIHQVVLDSPAKMVMCGSHFSSMMTPPKIFKKMMPFYQSFAQRLHERGKLLVCHADADTSLLLELLVEAGYDVMDSYVTSPMVPVTLEEARVAFGSRVIIWGGLPSTLLCDPVSDEEFEDYMMCLFRVVAPGDAFILAVADNIMPETKVERLERVAEMIEEYGTCPINA